MIVMVALGAGLGLGLWALLVWARPARPSLATVLHRLHTPEQLIETPVARRVRVFAAFGLPSTRVRGDLALTETAIDRHVQTQLLATGAGLVLPVLACVALALLDTGPGWEIAVLVGLFGAVAGFVVPDLALARRAQRLRAELDHAVAGYLSMARILLAAGAGVESALTDAATISDTTAFTRIRATLATARITRTNPWSALAQLGSDLGVPALREVGAVLSLAGTEGARVRESLTAKTASLRERQAADTEAAAAVATERMALPTVLLCAGFLLFLGYPALAVVLGGI
ncbi:type II secretion system F family protein [Allokutzneria albata]|uniref:Type II secretion system (T2SS), protein F n=1 Tax=Allokutzneria albata TaxID=211114 RepID=A0A1G9YBJ6_ALLAB|nr:type II secretion system F family protein [Allokutzneria albata]SDN05905.1 Type II secretion system (T2SS), protein F [Allokutzneria albata]